MIENSEVRRGKDKIKEHLVGFRRRGRSAEDLDQWYDESKGFSGPGSSVDGDIFEAAKKWNSGRLDGRAILETGLCEGTENGLRERWLKIGKTRIR